MLGGGTSLLRLVCDLFLFILCWHVSARCKVLAAVVKLSPHSSGDSSDVVGTSRAYSSISGDGTELLPVAAPRPREFNWRE